MGVIDLHIDKAQHKRLCNCLFALAWVLSVVNMLAYFTQPSVLYAGVAGVALYAMFYAIRTEQELLKDEIQN